MKKPGMAHIQTNYLHACGPVVICTGIGTLYGAYARKPNGSLKRIVPIRQYHDPADVERELQSYKGSAIWTSPDPTETDHVTDDTRHE